MTSREAILALNLLPSIGPVRISRLLDAFGNAEKILTASANQLQRVDEAFANIQPITNIDSAEDVRLGNALTLNVHAQ
ncbi:MAG: hypothetical protein ACK57I_14405 [Akkermansiaceae bacterium]